MDSRNNNKTNAYDLITEDLDIYTFPEPRSTDPAYNKDKILVLGDLHGNSVKLLHFLLRENVVAVKSQQSKSFLGKKKEISPKKVYEKFVAVCDKDVDVDNHPLVNLNFKEKAKDLERLKPSDREDANKQLSLLKSEIGGIKQLKEKDVQFVDRFIDELEIKSKPKLLVLLGDDFSDRKKTPDSYMAKLFEKLHKENIPFVVLYSNHGVEFLSAYLRGFKNVLPISQQREKIEPPYINTRFFYATRLGMFDNSLSLQSLGAAFQKKLLNMDEVNAIIQKAYLPHLKLFVSFPTENGIDIFTHGMVGFETLMGFADALNIPFKDETPQALHQTLEAISEKFDRIFKSFKGVQFSEFLDVGGHLDTLYKKKSFDRKNKSNKTEDLEILAYYFYRLIWSRDVSNRQLENGKDYATMWWHGHEERENKELSNVITLDSPIGKDTSDWVGQWARRKDINEFYFVPSSLAELAKGNREGSYLALRMDHKSPVLNQEIKRSGSKANLFQPANDNNASPRLDYTSQKYK